MSSNFNNFSYRFQKTRAELFARVLSVMLQFKEIRSHAAFDIRFMFPTAYIHHSELRSCTDTAERILADIERIIVTDTFIDTDELDEAVSASLSRYSMTEPVISYWSGIVSASIKSHSGDSFVISWEVDILSSRVLLDISCKEHETDIKRSVRADFFEL